MEKMKYFKNYEESETFAQEFSEELGNADFTFEEIAEYMINFSKLCEASMFLEEEYGESDVVTLTNLEAARDLLRVAGNLIHYADPYYR